MTYDPLHRRHSIRYPGFDYATANAYFVTVCTQDPACLFGEVVDGEIVPSIAGAMVESWWYEVSNAFQGAMLDAHVVMPNHFHGVVFIGATLAPDTPHAAPGGHVTESRGPSLSRIVQWFKTMTTNDYINGVQHHGLPPFRNRLWQRSFHDRIIRGDTELDHIRQYIDANPAAWQHDRENPAYMPPSASMITTPSPYSPQHEEYPIYGSHVPGGG